MSAKLYGNWTKEKTSSFDLIFSVHNQFHPQLKNILLHKSNALKEKKKVLQNFHSLLVAI